MNRISSTPNLNTLRWQESGNALQRSLPDNWKHLRKMSHYQSMPRMIAEIVEPTASSETAYNINRNCLDYQGNGITRHNIARSDSAESQQRDGDNHLSSSSSSEDLEDSGGHGAFKPRSMSTDSVLSAIDTNVAVQLSLSNDQQDTHDAASRVRTMSIDDAISEGEEDASNATPFPLSREPDIDCHSDTEADTCASRAQDPSQDGSLGPDSSFFKLTRRASFDNGVFGLPDRILHGEIGCGVTGAWQQRNAVTVPGTPADCSTPVPRDLSEEEQLVEPEQVFNRIYNLLCAERVTQMTKTYNDIEAVTRLLEEKERDLELAARIGQTLLSKNKELSTRGDTLDEQLNYANEKINQLKHDLSMKDELLKFYCQDLQDQSPTDSSPGPGANLSKINVDTLQKKVSSLEEENLSLRLESAQLRSDTETYEEKEKKLVEDCLQQLADVNQELATFAEELKLKTEESSRQKEEVTSLLSQVADLHKRVRKLTVENMDLAEKLQASQDSQRQLTKQLSGQQDRYDELFEMLEEAQDELRGHRNRDTPKARRHAYASSALAGTSSPMMNSLASELESSLQQDNEEKSQRKAYCWKVFETARAARKAAAKSSRSSSVRMSASMSGSQAPSTINSDNESLNSEGYNADMDSIYGSCSELGRPGIPGSNDLENALRRLALRRANEMNEHDFMQSQRETRSEGMSPMATGMTPDGSVSPASCYSYLGENSASNSATPFKLSDKLKIVKPLEGSVTLRHWQRLAQPHLGGLFEHRDGVKVKGERQLDLEGEVYTLSDFEEDDVVECPSRRAADSSTVYTFTNSVVSQPSERNQHQSSQSVGSNLQKLGTSETMTSPSMAARKASSSSSISSKPKSGYTMSLGLAAILQERGSTSSTGAALRPITSCSVLPSHTTTTTTTAATTQTAVTVTTSSITVSSAARVVTPDSFKPAGIFSTLVDTGFALLWNKSDCPASSAAAQSVSSASVMQSSPEHLSGGAAGDRPDRSKVSGQVLSGSSAGVLGAIANFRKSGIL